MLFQSAKIINSILQLSSKTHLEISLYIENSLLLVCIHDICIFIKRISRCHQNKTQLHNIMHYWTLGISFTRNSYSTARNFSKRTFIPFFSHFGSLSTPIGNKQPRLEFAFNHNKACLKSRYNIVSPSRRFLVWHLATELHLTSLLAITLEMILLFTNLTIWVGILYSPFMKGTENESDRDVS